MQRFHEQIIAIASIALYALINAVSLTHFPLMHSDESWIAGLTRHMLNEKSLFVTEPFFDLFPRSAHLIKSGFHLMQMPFIALGGYSLFGVRMLSLTFSIFCLILVYKIYQKESNTKIKFFALLILMSNIEFIKATHFARQEMLMLFLFLLAFSYIITLWQRSDSKTIGWKQTLLLSSIIGFAISVHPNALLLAMGAGLVYLFFWRTGTIRFHQLVLLIVFVASYAALLAGMSLYVNPEFIQTYSAYGKTMGVSNSLASKGMGFVDYYRKIYSQIGATYYIPQERFLLITGGIALFWGTVKTLTLLLSPIRRDHLDLVSSRIIVYTLFIWGMQAGLLVIGRFNTNYILFPLLFSMLLFLELTYDVCSNSSVSLRKSQVLSAILILFILLQSINVYNNITDHPQNDYPDYLAEIGLVLSPEDKTLGNLNTGFFFADTSLLDFRNLSYLPSGLSLQEYLEQNNITAIILPEEMDYIARNQDPWRILYGPLDYYPALQALLKRDYLLAHSFTSPGYGMRIVRYLDGYPWGVQIYIKKAEPRSPAH